MQRLTGLIAAPYTPMHEDGSINLNPIEEYAHLLVSNGVSGAFICGTTGESMSLTIDERSQVAERWRSVIGEELAVIIHVGHTCLADCKALAAHAQQIGARAIGAMAPFFFKPASLEDLVSFCAEVASAAPHLPFYYYHMPSMTGVDFRMADFLEMASDRIPSLGGIKYTYEDLMDFGRCVAFQDGKFNLLFGRDEILLTGLSLGAAGAVGSTYNFAAPIYHRIIRAFESGDHATARSEQVRAMEMAHLLGRFGGSTAGKATMGMIGLDCGPARLPQRSLSDTECDSLRAELQRIGFFGYCSKP